VARSRLEALLVAEAIIAHGLLVPDVALDDLVATGKAVVADQVLVDAGGPEVRLPPEPTVHDVLEGIEHRGRVLLPTVERLGALRKVALDRPPVTADHPADLCVGVTLAAQGVDVHPYLLVDHLPDLPFFKTLRTKQL
jgi:hypothetical protein